MNFANTWCHLATIIVCRIICCCLVAKSYLALCDSVDCSLPGSSVLGIIQQEYWSGLPFPSLGDLLDLGIKPESSAFAGRSFIADPPGKPIQNKFVALK